MRCCTHLVTILLAAVLCVSASHAAVFEHDWQTPGDGLLTFDNVNQREWLDIPWSLSEFFGTGLTFEDYQIAIDNALLELQPGGSLEEFTLATRADVIALAESANIDTTTLDPAANFGPTNALLDLIGAILDSSLGRQSLGLVDESCGVCFPPVAANILAIGNANFPGDSGLEFFHSDDRIGPLTTGLMLYRFVIPETPSIVLALIGTLVICSSRHYI